MILSLSKPHWWHFIMTLPSLLYQVSYMSGSLGMCHSQFCLFYQTEAQRVAVNVLSSSCLRMHLLTSCLSFSLSSYQLGFPKAVIPQALASTCYIPVVEMSTEVGRGNKTKPRSNLCSQEAHGVRRVAVWLILVNHTSDHVSVQLQYLVTLFHRGHRTHFSFCHTASFTIRIFPTFLTFPDWSHFAAPHRSSLPAGPSTRHSISCLQAFIDR